MIQKIRRLTRHIKEYHHVIIHDPNIRKQNSSILYSTLLPYLCVVMIDWLVAGYDHGGVDISAISHPVPVTFLSLVHTSILYIAFLMFTIIVQLFICQNLYFYNKILPPMTWYILCNGGFVFQNFINSWTEIHFSLFRSDIAQLVSSIK